MKEMKKEVDERYSEKKKQSVPQLDTQPAQQSTQRTAPSVTPSTAPSAAPVLTCRVTQGQLEAIALRVRDELGNSLHRMGTAAHATIEGNVLKVEIEHSLSAAEHNMMRRTSGRNFFQHYLEELSEQIYPTFGKHIEDILPVRVTFSEVNVDGVHDSIIFTFGVQQRARWTKIAEDLSEYGYEYA